MRIGITTDLRHSMFSSGHANASLAAATVFKAMDTENEIVLIHRQDGSDWWEDVVSLKDSSPKRISLKDQMAKDQPLDFLLEISFNLSPAERAKVAKRSVWYSRKPALFSDLEATVYANKPEARELDGLSAIWLADAFTHSDDIIYMQTLYPSIPIETVPWIWTPEIVEAHRAQGNGQQSPVWQQVYKFVPPDTPWSLHISESNSSSTSSCTLPLVIVRNAQTQRKMPISRIVIHNMDALQTNKYFNENVYKHITLADLSYNIIGRQRIIDWVHDPKSIIVSHSRFVDLKMANLEAAWVGIPVIHNSEVLLEIGNGLEKLHYSNNSVVDATAALHRAIFETDSISYLVDLEALTNVRKEILNRFFPVAKLQEWANAFVRCINSSYTPAPIAAPEQAPVQAPVQAPIVAPEQAPVQAPISTPMATPMASPIVFTVLFTDMWDQFNEQYNMFLLAIEAGLKGKNVSVKGHSLDTLNNVTPDLVIFGPFGEQWKELSDAWPKVHYTGENSPPVKDASVKLNIGYKLPEISDDTYLRMPLWMFEIDWFGADLSRLQNPLPLPIDACTKVNPNYTERSEFCAFVVTNPMNSIRNNAFMTLNRYKPVSSAGRLFNNVGDIIYAGLGGGGGELKKHEFLKQYRFCIAYENSSSPGYTTEKLLHAKAAGCVPIYWGDPKVGREFNEKGFINASGCKSEMDLVALVDEYESDPAKWHEMASVPALSSYNRDLVRRTFSEMVRRFFIVAGRNDLTVGLPSFIGAKNSAEADAMRPKIAKVLEPPKPVQPVQAIQPVQTIQATNIEVPFFVTAATQRFWPFLLMWLNSLESHRKAVTSIKARVYVGTDVAEAALKMTQDKFAEFAEFIRFPTEAPIDFPDFWHPQHYAWKLWIYNSLVNDPVLKANNQLVLYMDCASVMMRWPTEWIQHALTNGISFLEDCRQKNKYWCHTYFCQIMEVTEEEKEQQQVLGGILLFIAGNEKAQEVFTEAYKLAQLRPLIVGDKCEGIGPDGKPFGHRHDQSILSILSSRMGLSRFPIDKVYGDKSARTTFHSGQSIYVHRGNFQSHSPILPGIDDTFVINLDRREDRRKAFLEEHPDLKGHVRRLAAYDGRKLQLTPSMTRLFKTNDFFWKKAVMGCALSHLKLWNLLISEPPEIQSYFIMEDDARLSPGWREAWLKAYPNLPDGWDCVYLGGILPPNRQAFSMTLERVADGLAKVAPNKIFGQSEPNTYFHFCAYAYVLSRRGAEKIIRSILEHDGYWTSADHMVCNKIDTMNLYVLDPLVAGASQDNDPIYQNAQFNNFSRVDNFDSDLWNNDERFSESEVLEQLGKGAPLQITASIAEVDTALLQVPGPVAPVAPVTVKVTLPKHKGPCFVSLDICNLSYSTLYESNWLQDLFQTQQFNIKQVSMYDDLDEYDELIVIIIRPKWQEQTVWLETLRSYGKKFKILHIGDEHSQDPIHMYSWPEVTGVLRFYTRSDLPVDPKISVLPLGYHAQFKGNRDVPHMSTPDLPFRELMWSFAGTDWHNRCNDLEILNKIQPNFSKWFEDWNDQKQLKDNEYISLLLNSKFVPCPGGQNTETFRFYEALDCGCIPLFIDCPPVLDGKIPFLKMQSWEHAAALMHHFRENVEQMEDYRRAILVSWAKYKMELKEKVRVWLTV